MKKSTKTYVEEHINLIEKEDFDALYNGIGRWSVYDPSDLTETLLNAGIDPITYFKNTIPRKYARGIKSFKDIVIPGSITTIDESAFRDCINLEEIRFPQGLKHIASYAFTGCDHLTELYLPDNVELVNSCAFWNCTSLKKVSINSGNSVAFDAFWGCDSLHNIELRGPSTEIGKVFQYPDALKEYSSIQIITCTDKVVDLETLVRNTL